MTSEYLIKEIHHKMESCSPHTPNKFSARISYERLWLTGVFRYENWVLQQLTRPMLVRKYLSRQFRAIKWKMWVMLGQCGLLTLAKGHLFLLLAIFIMDNLPHRLTSLKIHLALL